MTDDKYNFWVDRKVGDHIYRFHSTGINRADKKTPHSFRPWKEYKTSRELVTAWRNLCDQEAAEKESA